MSMQFKQATKKQLKLRLALAGPSGSGKTYSALAIASGLGERIAVIDTEHGSASLYADRFKFDTLTLGSFAPSTYVEAIHAAESAGYEVIVIDSLSHAWMGKDGALEQVDAAAKRNKGNSYVAWRDVTPQHNALVDAMVQCKAHLVGTMRTKMAYEIGDENGKKSVKKLGMAPIQREGLEYEFTVFGDVDLDHNLVITKTRCSELAGKVITKPGAPLAKTLRAWLDSGEAQAEKPSAPPAKPADHSALLASIQKAPSLEALAETQAAITALPPADQKPLRDGYAARKKWLTDEASKSEPAKKGAA